MSCAFDGCGDPASCCLVGGCVPRRFGKCPTLSDRLAMKTNAPALNGTKPPREVRDPRFIKRKRKALR